ncbi:PEP-utilizing enzyme [Ornithinimicrobium sp. W1679]|uniref:PEP-utilizing enzyme n=1 Tax=Ornithinimicrobium sp. W1679 TaxID=3418770 RepID=UPI003CF4D213
MSKAATLRHLSELGAAAFDIDPFIEFTRREWESSPTDVLESVRTADLGPRVAVRSSATAEGLEPSSSPGIFATVLNVDISISLDLVEAVERIFGSFAKSSSTMNLDDQRVLVQTFVDDVSVAGVVTTLDANRVPYLTVEYDDRTGRTDSVTSGLDAKRLVLSPAANDIPAQWTSLCEAVRIVSTELDRADLVIEFAIDREDRVHIFQAWDRGRTPVASASELHRAIIALEGQLDDLRGTRPRVVLSDMADWNPAEILGKDAGPLDISLYRHLLTDLSCREARRDLGYSFGEYPLMVELGTRPYVDVGRSIASLSPGRLSPTTQSTYADACLSILEARPSLHDKLEHSVLFTYWPFRGHEALVERFQALLPSTALEELSGALRVLTGDLFARWSDVIDGCSRDILMLDDWRRQNRRPENLNAGATVFIAEALEVCRKFGALPFATVARLAFIADGLVKEMAAAEAITDADVKAFWCGINTPADEFLQDLGSDLHLERIVERYGHLRPHSYNIDSLRYRDRSDFLSRLSTGYRTASRPDGATQNTVIDRALADYCRAELGVSDDSLLTSHMLSRAISTREWHKFSFTSLLGDVLELIADIAETGGLTRSDARKARIESILAAPDVAGVYQAIEAGMSRHIVLDLAYPDMIRSHRGLQVVESAVPEPTFVTDAIVEGEVVVLGDGDADPSTIDGRIVLIESADPGCDWIFSRPLLALVTCYGGVSSHIAIRCQEAQIPAAIGCGTATYAALSQLASIAIDCGNGIISPGGESWTI